MEYIQLSAELIRDVLELERKLYRLSSTVSRFNLKDDVLILFGVGVNNLHKYCCIQGWGGVRDPAYSHRRISTSTQTVLG